MLIYPIPPVSVCFVYTHKVFYQRCCTTFVCLAMRLNWTLDQNIPKWSLKCAWLWVAMLNTNLGICLSCPFGDLMTLFKLAEIVRILATLHFQCWHVDCTTAALIARFMGPTWGTSGADRTQVGPMLAPWTLLSGTYNNRRLRRWYECVYVCVCVLDIAILLCIDKRVPVAHRLAKLGPSRHFLYGLVRNECWKKSNNSINLRLNDVILVLF